MKTLKLRIKDKHCSVLNQLARQVNFVWNYSNALCFQHLQRTGKFFSALAGGGCQSLELQLSQAEKRENWLKGQIEKAQQEVIQLLEHKPQTQKGLFNRVIGAIRNN